MYKVGDRFSGEIKVRKLQNKIIAECIKR